MIHGTHSAFGAALMETILVAEHVPLTWRAGAAVVLAALVAPFPDIDHKEAWVTRHIPFAGIVGSMFQHRTVTHSLLFSLALYLLLFFVLPIPLWFASGIFVGWVSHWLIDLFNPMGVQLFYPAKLWVKQPISVDVNGPGEHSIFVILRTYAAVLAALYPVLVLPKAYLSVYVLTAVLMIASAAMPRFTGRKYAIVAVLVVAFLCLSTVEHTITWAAQHYVQAIADSPIGRWATFIHIKAY